MVKKIDSNKARLKRHKRVRAKISGTGACPRLCVFRSNKHIYAQIIDDTTGPTLASARARVLEGAGGYKAAAGQAGEVIAKRAGERKIADVVFDRGGYLYHGRVKELADGARKGGLKF